MPNADRKQYRGRAFVRPEKRRLKILCSVYLSVDPDAYNAEYGEAWDQATIRTMLKEQVIEQIEASLAYLAPGVKVTGGF